MRGALVFLLIAAGSIIIPQHMIPLMLTAGFAWFAIRNGR